MKCRDVRDEVGGHDRGWFRRCKGTHTRRIPMEALERDEKRALGTLRSLVLLSSFLTLPGIPR